MDVKQYLQSRPYAYHLTAESNLPGIRQSGELLSAAQHLGSAGALDRCHEKRADHVSLQTPQGKVTLRDQAPLYAGNVQLDDGWSFSDLVSYINQHVFFWPGGSDGPIASGKRHFARYAHERNVIIRVATASLFRANEGNMPLFCRYNSGAPRVSGGKYSPRGADTYVAADRFQGPSSKVVEFVFRDRAVLPGDCDFRAGDEDQWRRLF